MTIAPPTDQQEALKQILANRDVICPRCQHNLRGSTSLVCGECGSTLYLVRASRRPTSWRVTVVSLAISFGLTCLQSLSVLISVLEESLDPWVLLVFLPITVAYGLCLRLAIKRAQWFSSRKPGARRLLATAALLLGPGFVLAGMLFVFVIALSEAMWMY